MMVETAFTLEDACRRAEEMIIQLSRCPRDSQGQRSLDISTDKLSAALINSYKKDSHHVKASIHSKITRLYFEQLEKYPRSSQDSILNKLENECDLLGRLVQREKLYTLIVNLNPGNKGYSLCVKNCHKGVQYDKNTLISETQLMGYEQGELLTCIDNGELPATLAEQLEINHSHLFYDGCIIAEIRDFRKSHPHNKPEIHHVLLKPTTQSILSDVSTLTSDGDWTHEERLVLESHIVAATQGPLCLDPNPVHSLAMTKIRQSKILLADQQLMRQARKFSQVTVNRKRKLEQLGQSEGLTIQDLMQKLRSKNRIPQTISTACSAPMLINPPLPPPNTEIDVMKYAKAYEQPRESKDCSPQLVEEYILETERGQGRIYHIKLTILQRPSDSEYLGELYVDIDFREGEKKGSSCRFTLGTRAQANHYIQQFTEIFTEEGRKNVKIQHVIPGQQPRVTCTPGMHRAQQQAQQQAQQVQQQQQQVQQHQQPIVRVHPQQAQLVAQQIQAQSQRVAQQILSRAQSQINNLVVTNPIKTMSDVPTRQTNLGNCLDSVVQNIPTEIVQNDATSVNINQGMACNNSNPRLPLVTGITTQQFDNASVGVTMATADGTPCNGSTGILVFQQKPLTTLTTNNTSNVPVLQAQLQAGTCNSLNDTSNPNSILQRNSTNLAISALANSLMDSAQQFTQQQQAAAAAAAAALNNNVQNTSKTNNNAAIRSLLNSTPANLVQPRARAQRTTAALLPQRVVSHGNIITVPNTTGQVRLSFSPAIATQQIPAAKPQPAKTTTVRLDRVQDTTSSLGLSMPGLSALLAGTPDDSSVPGITASSTLFERLTASSSSASSQPTSPMTSPPPQTPPQQTANVNLQSVNLASLPNTINGLQNVQVSIPGLSQPITMSLNVSAGGNVVTPAGVIVSLPISSGTNTCTTVSSMVAATVVSTAIAGSTPTVVLANPGNAHLSLPIAQLIPSGVKGLTQQNLRNANAAVTLYQSGQAIHLVGSPKPRHNQMARVQSNKTKTSVLPNQLVTVAKTVTANQLILSGNKQVLTPIIASKPMLMTTQTIPSPQASVAASANKQTLLAKSLQARAAATQNSTQQTFASFSPQQLQQLQQCLAAQRKANVATGTISNANRTQMQPQRNADDTM